MNNYPKNWSKEKIKEWEMDLNLISGIMGLFCLMSPGGKRKMAHILKEEDEQLEESYRQGYTCHTCERVVAFDEVTQKWECGCDAVT